MQLLTQAERKPRPEILRPGLLSKTPKLGTALFEGAFFDILALSA